MTDPVRPVGWMGGEYDRDDDQWEHLPLAQRIVALVSVLRAQGAADWHAAAVKQVEKELAASPVPCAASPADDFIAQLRRWHERLWDSPKSFYATVGAMLEDLRATGEGARDAMDANHNGKPAPVGDEPVRGDDAASDPRRIQGKVAVSLDPHRQEALVLEWARANGLSIDQLAELCARLRGEATVRPDDWELRARQMLWLGHGCGIAPLYGDDGELQCNNTARHRPLDFKREDWDVLQAEILRLNLATVRVEE